MAMSPAVHEPCTNAVVERKLDELCASLRSALAPPLPRSPDAETLLVGEIKYKIDFLRSFLTAERDCRIGARPAYLVEAEERFAVLKATFDEWARRVVPPHPAEEEEGKVMEALDDDDDGSGSDCSCTDSCQELTATDHVAFDEAPMDVTSDSTDKKCGREQDSVVVRCEEVYSPDTDAKKRDTEVLPREVETTSYASPEKRDRERDSVVTREEVTPDAVAKKRDTEGADVVPREEEATSDASAKKRDAEHRTKVDDTDSSTDRRRRRWWRRSGAWCGAAGVLAVVAVGLAVELAAVDHHNMGVYVVPT